MHLTRLKITVSIIFVMQYGQCSSSSFEIVKSCSFNCFISISGEEYESDYEFIFGKKFCSKGQEDIFD